MGETFRRVVTGRRRALWMWTLALVAFMALIVVAYPAVRDSTGFSDMMEEYPEWVEQILGLGTGLTITSPAGYLNSQVFSNTLPIILLIFMIGFASRETAGEEQEGLLDLQLSHPVTRQRVMAEKAGAMLITSLGLGLISALTLMATGPLVDMSLGFGGYVGATMSTVLVCWVFGALALAIGAVTGSRAAAIGIPSGLALVLYVLWGLAPLITQVEFTNAINPWYWGIIGDPILNGVQVGNAALLLGMTGSLIAVAVWGLRRRDLGV